MVIARTLGPREDVHLRTLSSSLGCLSGPEPHTFFVHGVRSHLPDYISVLGCHCFSSHGPQYLTCYLSSNHPQGSMVTQSQSPHHLHLGSFFLADPGGNQRNGWPPLPVASQDHVWHEVPKPGLQETGPCWYVRQQL